MGEWGVQEGLGRRTEGVQHSGGADEGAHPLPPGSVAAALCGLLLFAILRTWSLSRGQLSLVDGAVGESEGRGGAKSNVLLLIAHPDDEAMFFVPTLLAIRERYTVHVLSMSNGDFDGLGKTREEELRKSCSLLGVPSDRVTVVDDPGLQDGKGNHWDEEHIEFHLLPFIKREKIEAIVSFDEQGVSESRPNVLYERSTCSRFSGWKEKIEAIVSFDEQGVPGHPNHIALHSALVKLRKAGRFPPKLRLLKLQSVPIWRKFIGPLAALEPGAGGLSAFSIDLPLVHRALQAHRSQAVWYRLLFIIFGRYTFANTLRDIE